MRHWSLPSFLHINTTRLAQGLCDGCIAPISNIFLRCSLTLSYILGSICQYPSLNGVLSVSLMLCLTRDVLPKSILLIAKILALSVMSSLASFLSLLHSPNPDKSISFSNPFDFHYSFSFSGFLLIPPCPVGFWSNGAGTISAGVISPTVVCFGRVTCLALWFLRQTLILHFPGFSIP